MACDVDSLEHNSAPAARRNGRHRRPAAVPATCLWAGALLALTGPTQSALGSLGGAPGLLVGSAAGYAAYVVMMAIGLLLLVIPKFLRRRSLTRGNEIDPLD